MGRLLSMHRRPGAQRLDPRHLTLAADVVTGGPSDELAIVQRVAMLLARLDDARVPVESIGAAYVRGQRDTLTAVIAEADAGAAAEDALGFRRGAAAFAALSSWAARRLAALDVQGRST